MEILLSKSSYLSGLRCHKSLYLSQHGRELRLADPLTDNDKKRIEDGNKIGLLARQLFPKGAEVIRTFPWNPELDARKTKEMMNSGFNVIYEACFIYQEVFCAVDILVRDGKSWRLLEIKASSEVKEHFYDDASLQYWVLKNSGVDVADASVVTINTDYIRNGKIEPQKLFSVQSVFEEVKVRETSVAFAVKEHQKILGFNFTPEIKIGKQCFEPLDCPFMGYCWKSVPENSVFDIGGLYKERKFELFHSGTRLITEVKDNYKLSDTQRIQVDSHKSNKPRIDTVGINTFLKTLKYPLYFFDIETFAPPIPMFGNFAYQRIPFQYSLHYMKNESSGIKHSEFLAEPQDGDPRLAFLRSLLSATETPGKILVYNQAFESSVLKELARDFPKYEDKILERISRMVDLAEPFRKKMYYTPEMKGSYSIKNVLPALVPGFSYANLEIIKDGITASNLYQSLYEVTDKKKIEKVLDSLRKYCSLDTLAMVKILEALEKAVK